MEPMKRHTTFRIGGPVVYISPGSEVRRAERGAEPVKRVKISHGPSWEMEQPVSQ